MSPADAKRGAKRRKNKRGGGSGSSSGSNSSAAGDVKAAALRGQHSAAVGASSGGAGSAAGAGLISSSSTPPGTEIALNGTPFTDGPLSSDFTGVPQAPFTFGLGQRAPYTTGEHCLLCRSERKDLTLSECGTKNSSKLALSTSPKSNAKMHLPLWVCSDCRRTVESEDIHPTPDQSLVSQDFLLHMPPGNSGSKQESVGGGRMLVGAQTVAPTVALNNSAPPEMSCGCDACNERREISAETERESQQLQNYWSDVRYMIRCIYRQAGTPLADDQDQSLVPEKDGMKDLVDRLCERDPYQLYQRLEQQAREYVLEMKVRLLKHLSLGFKVAPNKPPQAHQFISLLLEEYSALCQAACTIGTFLITLENEHLKKFQVTWELHNKHLFENLVFSEPLLQNSLPALVSQLRLGTTSHDSYSEDMYSTLLQRYLQLEQEMGQIAEEWLECQKRIDNYVDEQMALQSKHRMLKEDWEYYKQRMFIEEQLNNKKALTGENNFADKMRHMLSTRMCMSDCPNCNYRRRCTCDDCSLSHILTCGIMDTPIADDIHLNPLPLQVDATPDYLSEIHPPSMSSTSSGSGPNSPITIQQHPRLILADNGSAPTFGSDDEDGAPLSAKFADIYPLNNYDDADVVANMNGIHSELNGGGENMALKDESPSVSSTSSSSSEADDEEADGESGSEQPDLSKEGIHVGKRSPRKEGPKMDSPPPSYLSPQVETIPNTCECHVCKQEASGLSPSAVVAGRLPPGHQFVNPDKPTHPALHLYPHIHGHLPLHTIPHLPRPVIHPTLYASPFAHNKALPPTTVQNHINKHQVFNASLQDHIYPTCFGNSPEWNRSKFISLWNSEMMNEKNWNPTSFLPDPLAGGDILGPALPEIRPETLPTTSSNETTPVPDVKEKKNTAKKKCLYNFQDAFIEANKVVMATSSATSSVSCTATTVQSSSNQFKMSSKRPSSIGDVFHNIKEEHRHPSTPVAPRNSPTSLASLPNLSPATHSSASTPHHPNINPQPFPKTAATAPGFVDPHLGFCPSTAAPPTSATDSTLSAPPSVCSDPDCEGHRCENSAAYDHQPYDGEESQDEDSCSEHSSSTSTSTNQKEGKYCDCCYCEFFGHGGPPSAPTSRNYTEMREKLRLRLTKRKEEQPKKPDLIPEKESGVVDHRRVEDLVQFINSSESKPVSSSRAAKRARHKQRKEYGASPAMNIVGHELGSEGSMQGFCTSTAEERTDKAEAEPDRERPEKQQLEEKARQEAETREREDYQLLEEQRQQEEEERFKREFHRHQECVALKKKKKDRSNKDGHRADRPIHSTHLCKEAATVLLPNGTLEQETISIPPPTRHCHKTELSPFLEAMNELPNHTNGRDLKSYTHKEVKAKQQEQLSLLLDLVQQKENHVKQKPKSQVAKLSPEQVKKSEAPKLSEPQPKPKNQSETKVRAVEVAPLVEQKKEEKKAGNGNNKKQLNYVKEEKPPAPCEATIIAEQQHNKPLITAESPQPKGKSKRNKKKKGEKVNNSIDDVFLPKDIDLDSVEMDETEREVEYFKRFCLDSARQTRQRLSINWSNFSLKKTTYAAH
ncbi:protein FAM193A isoform X1 [Bufo gargarizans]|uniref:protein FAM193A isoform X1 n=1 Tax=Bufo gargarizans TaxID=30331 RepID=UPI001CF5973B|nr:protein FAM193A isoform X1 [Bufo gargarizans]